MINGEDGAGRTIFRGHIADSGTVSKWYCADAFPIEFHEFSNHTVLAKHISNGKNNICSGDTRLCLASKFKANNTGDKHGDGLAKHSSLGFNTTDAPAQNAKTIFHGGVGISTHAGIGVEDTVIVHNNAC